MLTAVGKTKLRRTEHISLRYLYLPTSGILAFSKGFLKVEGHLILMAI